MGAAIGTIKGLYKSFPKRHLDSQFAAQSASVTARDKARHRGILAVVSGHSRAPAAAALHAP